MIELIWLLGWVATSWAGPGESLPAVSEAEAVLEVSGWPGEQRVERVPLGRPTADGFGARGAVARLVRTLEGLPVDEDGALWLRPDGTERARRLAPVRPLRRGVVIDADHVDRIAAQAGAGQPGPARLSWQPVAGALRKVYTVPMRHARHPDFEVPVVRIDAVSGAVIGVEEGAHSLDAIAEVYQTNPTMDPELSEVRFELPGPALADDRMEIRQCRDRRDVITLEVDGERWDYHVCTEVPATEAADGDFRSPAVPYPSDPARDEDDFAAPTLYWHISRGMDWFEERGWASLPEVDPYLEVVANQRDTDELTRISAGNPKLPLAPYDNAYHMRGYFDTNENWVAPRLVFGQGAEIDYAYDADVTYHELAHFIVSTRHGPSYTSFDSYGFRVEGGAINEGLADYFSSAILGDPVLAEYAAGSERDHIRTLLGTEHCAADMAGQTHNDSRPFAQGLWAFRATLPAPYQRRLDELVIDALTVIGRDATFAEAIEVIGAAVSDVLGADAAASLQGAWVDRGVDACPPVAQVPADADIDEPVRRFTQVGYFNADYYEPYSPGYAQFVVDVPAAGTVITVEASQAEFLGIDPWGTLEPLPPRLVGRSGSALSWTFEEVVEKVYDFEFVTYVFDHDGEDLGVMEEIRTRPHGSVPPRYLWHDYRLEVEVDQAGPFTLQFANDNDGRQPTLYDVSFALEVPNPPPEPPEPPDPLGTTEPTEPAVASTPDDDSGTATACGCQSTGGAGWWLLGPLLLLLQRRA